jgi:hypothetical protein
MFGFAMPTYTQTHRTLTFIVFVYIVEVEDTELSLDEDDESDEDDEQLDYFQRKKTFMMAGAASTVIAGQARPPPTSFNYTVLTPEKLQDHPIILRGCDVNTVCICVSLCIITLMIESPTLHVCCNRCGI